jgi:hypothetical protein
MSVAEARTQIANALSSLDALKDDPVIRGTLVLANPQASQTIDRVFAIAELIRSHLKAPSILQSAWGLVTLHSVVQTVLTEMMNFISSGNVAHITNIEAQIDQNLLPHIASYMGPLQSGGTDEFAAAVDALESGARSSLSALNAQRSKLSADLMEMVTTVEKQNARIKELEVTIGKQQADALSTVERLNAEYAKSEGERAEQHRQAQTTLGLEFEELKTKLLSDTQETIKSLEGSRDQARRLLQIVGNDSTAGHYAAVAAEEGRSANAWRGITILLFLIGVVIAVITFHRFLDDGFHPESAWAVVIRLLFAIGITAPAWYTASEAARHRSNADQARQVELELASLGPFIDSLEKEQQHALREQLAKKYFGRDVALHEVNPPVSPADFKAVVMAAMELVKKRG